MVAQRLSVVIPALNEAACLRGTLESLAGLRRNGHEVIVVDGGSDDGTPAIASGLCDQVLPAPRGRARQMNAGAQVAVGDILVFVHADTRLPADAEREICGSLKKHVWGRFDVELEGRHPLLPLIAWAMNARSRLSGIATGDQAIFVRRERFEGFPEVALMEDVAFSAAMRRRYRPACLRSRAVTSARRWEERGLLRTVLLMWRLRLEFALGADPDRLAERYR